MMTVKITISEHLAEYVKGKFYDESVGAIRFPKNDDLWITIWDLTTRRPVGAQVDYGNVEIVLPERRIGKRAETYNYISQSGAQIIERKIRQRMRAEFHEYLQLGKHRYGYPYITTALLFLHDYGIKSITEDAIIKDHARWRDYKAKCKSKIPKKSDFA
jgi:hypothetical protein